MSEPISALSTETSAAIGPLSHTLGGGADAPHAALARICQMVIRESGMTAGLGVLRGYSKRKASMGSSWAALRAG